MDNTWIPLDVEANKSYLQEHHLHIYLEDAISQLLVLRQENSKIKPARFFREYFWSVQKGSHILFREYSFISATPYNRACVVKAILYTYKTSICSKEKLSAHDFHSMLQLLWPDFPFYFIQLTFSTINRSIDLSSLRITFKDFLTAFREQFCSGDFTYEAKQVYDQLLIYEDELAKENFELCSSGIDHNSESRQTNFMDNGDLITSLQESCETQKQLSSSWPSTDRVKHMSHLHKMLHLKEHRALSLSPEDVIEPPFGSTNFSGQGSAATPRYGSLRGQLCSRHLSNSLHMLPPEDAEKQDQDAHPALRRLRSKSAVNIQRSSTLPRQ